MKKPFSIILAGCLLVLIFMALPSQLLTDQYQVTRVIDGDTIKVEDGSKKITVRLVGIDAPENSKRKNEPGQPFSQRATKHLGSLVLNQYLEMVKTGLAEVYREKQAVGFDV